MRHTKRLRLTAPAYPSFKPRNVRRLAVSRLKTIFVVLLWISLRGWIALGQENRSNLDNAAPEDALITSLNAEKDRGEYTFYRQAYMDSDNRKAVYTGSIYGSITAFKVLECTVDLEVAIIDHFSGTIDGRPTGEQQDSTTYSLTFPVNRTIAENLVLRNARPAELSASTRSVCTERPSCTFTWLEIRGSPGEIRETQIVNEFLRFRGSAEHFLVPLSSETSGNRLMQAFRSLAREKCR
jgi:hypothetical protein